jgi:hypothetical protein
VIPFKTTPKQVMKLASIIVEMGGAGLDRNFIVAAFELARSDQGVYDLMALWHGTSDDTERDGTRSRDPWLIAASHFVGPFFAS